MGAPSAAGGWRGPACWPWGPWAVCAMPCSSGAAALPDYARSFYLGFSCGLALAGAVLLIRAQRLLAHPQEQKRARVREQDEREQSITLRAFALAGLIAFYLCAAALLVAVAVDRTAVKALLAVMAVYAAAFLAARWALAKRM